MTNNNELRIDKEVIDNLNINVVSVVTQVLLLQHQRENVNFLNHEAHAIIENGGLIAPVGINMVALATQRQVIPFVVLAGIHNAVKINLKWDPTSEGSNNESEDASVHSEATNAQQQPNIQPQIITTVSNNNAKFPYLKKDDLKRTGRDCNGRVIILPTMTTDEHIPVQGESKVRTTLLQSIPDDHVADFHYIHDARDIWNAVKARLGRNVESKKMRKSMLKQEFLEFRIGEAEGLHKGYDRMQKILSQLNQLKAKPEDEDINLKSLRALPSSWSQVALTLKTKCGLELLSFDDLYYKLKTLEVDVKGYTTFSSSQSTAPSHSAFVSTTSASKKMSYRDSLKQQLAYGDFEQIEKLDLEEMDLKWQMDMLSVRVYKFKQKTGRKIDFDKKESTMFNNKKRYSSFKIKEIGKKEEDSKALIIVDMLVDWTNHDGESDGVITSKEFGMIAGCDTEDEIKEGAAKIYNLITGADIEEARTAGDVGEFALMGVTSEVNHQNQFVPQAVFLRTGKVNIPPARPQPVPTGKPKVFAPVPTGRQNRPFPVPAGRGYSPSVIFGLWKSTARPMPHFSRPENPFPDAEDEGIFDSDCSRSMTGNKERLDDFQ
nr:hypothetical protein [Tanacetum cinerariifolium]